MIRDVFRQHGYHGASLTSISEATGLGRASLYHHFPGGKDEMVAAALDDVEAVLDERIIAALREAGRSPAQRLQTMAEELTIFHEGGRAACLFAVLALTAPSLQPRLSKVFARWLDALADLARESGRGRQDAQAAAEAALTSLEGALILAAAQGSKKPFQRALGHLPRIILGS